MFYPEAYLPEVVQTMKALARHLCDASTAATAVVCVTSVGMGAMWRSSSKNPYKSRILGYQVFTISSSQELIYLRTVRAFRFFFQW